MPILQMGWRSSLCRNQLSIDSRLNRIDPRKNIIYRPMQSGDIEPNPKHYLENYLNIS